MNYLRQFSSGKSKRMARAKDALGRLRANPADAVAVMAVYEVCGRELQEVAVRYFGKNQHGKKAVLNLLAAVVSRARSYDPQTMQAKEWVVQCAEGEAQRLSTALETCSNRGGRARRAM